MKKFFTTLALPLALAALWLPAAAAEGTSEAAVAETVTVLYTNDVHTYIDKDLGYSLAARYRDTLDNVLLVDAGDHI